MDEGEDLTVTQDLSHQVWNRVLSGLSGPLPFSCSRVSADVVYPGRSG